MPVKALIAMLATAAVSLAGSTIVHAAQEKQAMQAAAPEPTTTGHAAVNGVNYYYAVHGTGEPLLLPARRLRPDRDARTRSGHARAGPAVDAALPFLDARAEPGVGTGK
jgi:hypothetical protein